MPTEIDWDEVIPAEDQSVDPTAIDWDAVTPYNKDTSEGLRQRLKFNLENDYAPDQGNLIDQAGLGIREGISSLPGQVGGIASYFGADETGRNLSQYSQNKRAEFEDLGDTLGTSPWSQVTRQLSGQVTQQAPMLAAGVATGSLPLMVGMAGAQSLGSIQDEATRAYEAQGMSREDAVDQARVPAALGGLVTAALTHYMPGGLEALTTKMLSGQIAQGTARQIIFTAAKEALKEYPEEFVDQFAQGLAARYTYDPGKPWGEIVQESHDAGALGVGIGAATAPFHAAASSAGRNIDQARQVIDRAKADWERFMTEPDWQPPNPSAPGAAPVQQQSGPVSGLRPLESSDRLRVSLGAKVFKAAGYSPQFSQEAAEVMAGWFYPEASLDAEAYRAAILSQLQRYGIRPEASVGRNPARQAAQAEHNTTALAGIRKLAGGSRMGAPTIQPNPTAPPPTQPAQPPPPPNRPRPRPTAAPSAQAPFTAPVPPQPAPGNVGLSRYRPESAPAAPITISNFRSRLPASPVRPQIAAPVAPIAPEVTPAPIRSSPPVDEYGEPTNPVPIAHELKQSGLNETQIRERLATLGYQPKQINKTITEQQTNDQAQELKRILNEKGYGSDGHVPRAGVDALHRLVAGYGGKKWENASTVREYEALIDYAKSLLPADQAPQARRKYRLKAVKGVGFGIEQQQPDGSWEWLAGGIKTKTEADKKVAFFKAKDESGEPHYESTNAGEEPDPPAPEPDPYLDEDENGARPDKRYYIFSDDKFHLLNSSAAPKDRSGIPYAIASDETRAKWPRTTEKKFQVARRQDYDMGRDTGPDPVNEPDQPTQRESKFVAPKAKTQEEAIIDAFLHHVSAQSTISRLQAGETLGNVTIGDGGPFPERWDATAKGIQYGWPKNPRREGETLDQFLDRIKSEPRPKLKLIKPAQIIARAKEYKKSQPAQKPEAPTDATSAEAAYDQARQDFSKANASFTKTQKGYRAKLLTDEEFLAGKAAYDKAAKALDIAETKFIDAKNAEVEPPPVAPEPEAELPIPSIHELSKQKSPIWVEQEAEAARLLQERAKGIPVTKQPTAVAPAKPGEKLPLKEQKEFLLEALDTAIQSAPKDAEKTEAQKDWAAFDSAYNNTHIQEQTATENILLELAAKYNFKPNLTAENRFKRYRDLGPLITAATLAGPNVITIAVPDDGTFKVFNDKPTLSQFRKRVATQFPSNASLRYQAPSMPRTTATPVGTPPKTVKTSDKLKIAAEFGSEDDSRPILHYVLQTPKEIVATNGRFIVVIDEPGGPKKNTLHKSGKTRLDGSSEEVTKTVNGKETKETLTYKFPNWQQVIPPTYKDSLKKIDTGVLLENLAKVKALSTKDEFVKRKSVTLHKNPDGSYGLQAIAADSLDEYSVNVQKGAVPLGALAIDYAITAVQGLRALGNKTIDIDYIDDLSPFQFAGKGARVVLMPMRMSSLAAEGAPSQLAGAPPIAAATGVPGIRDLAKRSQLSDHAKAAFIIALDVLDRSGLDTSMLRLELTQFAENGMQGSVLGSVIRLAENADASAAPEEVAHLLTSTLRAEDLAALEAERIANLPPNAPPEIVAGNMSSETFQAMKLPADLYRFSNVHEYFGSVFGDKTAREAAVAKNPSLWKRLLSWFDALWHALKSIFQNPADSDRIYEAMRRGEQQYDPAKQLSVAVERAKFVTKPSEAANAAKLAKTAHAQKIEGEEFLAQVDAPVKVMEKHGVQNLPSVSQREFGYPALKGIQQIGEHHNGAPEDYASIRARSPAWAQERVGVMAHLHAVRLTHRLGEIAADGTKAAAELNSPEMQAKLAKMQSAFISALWHEQAFKSAQVAIQTSIAQAYEALKKENKSDLETARLEGELRNLKEVAASRVALERLLDDMTIVLMSTPHGIAALTTGGTSAQIGKIYRDLKKSTNQTITSDQLIGVASHLLSTMPDLRDRLNAVRLARNTGIMGAARARMGPLMDALKNNPAATLEKMMKEREKKMGDYVGAEFLFRQIQKEVTRELEPIYERIVAGQTAMKIGADPDWNRYTNSVSVHGRSYNGHPFDAFKMTADAPGGEILAPVTGRVAGLGTDLMTGNAALIRKRYNQAVSVTAELTDWINNNNPDHPDYDRHTANRDALQAYWGNVALLTPNHRDDPLPFTLSILNRTIDLGSGRLATQVKTAVSKLNQMTQYAKAWNSKATIQFEPLWKAAMRSHGLKWNNLTDNDLRHVSENYNLHFQELANSNQFRHGGLKLGDKSMVGWTVTKADMELLRSQVDADQHAYEIVRKHDRQITSDTRGLPEGVVVHRRAVQDSEFTLPRAPDRDRAPDLQPIGDAFSAYKKDPTPATLQDLSSAIESTWVTDGRAWLKNRNADFAHNTIFDGPGKAFEAISDQIQNGAVFRTFDSAINEMSQLSGVPVDEVRSIVAPEFGRIVHRFLEEIAKEVDPSKSTRIAGGDPHNSFTMARGHQLGPWTFYKTGWSNSDDVRAHGGQMISVALHRVEQGLRAQLADIKRSQGEFNNRVRELKATGVTGAPRLARAENKAGRRAGVEFDRWAMFKRRIGALENRIKEIDDAKTPTRTEASRVIGRYLSGVTRLLIGSIPTTIRNTGAVFPFRTIHAAGSGPIAAFLSTLKIGATQQIKMISSLAFSILKGLSLTPAMGIYHGVKKTLQGEGLKKLWTEVVRSYVTEFGRNLFTRIKDIEEMRDAGAYHLPDSVGEYDNHVADALYQGIPRDELSRLSKVALAPIAALESTLLAVIGGPNPGLGDAIINTNFWKFLNSSFGPNAVFKRKTLALSNRLAAGYYRNLFGLGFKKPYARAFDVDNPTSEVNQLAPEDLNLTADQLSRYRRSFLDAGLNFDAKIADYIKRLRADPMAQFLSKEENTKLANWGIDHFNRQNASNSPKTFQSNNPLIEWLKPLLNWPTRALSSFLDFMSVPTKVEGGSVKGKMAQWLVKATTAGLIGTMLVGTLSELQLEAVVRAYKRAFYQQDSPNKWPWEHETTGQQLQAFARYGLQSVPLAAIPINAVLPQTSPARASFDPSFVMIEKAKDLLAWISYGQQTGNWMYKTPMAVSGFYQDAKIFTHGMQSQSGLNQKRNIEAAIKRHAPSELLRAQRNFGGGAPANLSPLSPYGPRLWNGIFNGDKAEVIAAGREAMQTAKAIGKPHPRDAVQALFYNGNPMTSSLASKPTYAQYKAMLASMTPQEQAAHKAAERDYSNAARWLGFEPPTFFIVVPASTTASTLRRNQVPIGVRSLRR